VKRATAIFIGKEIGALAGTIINASILLAVYAYFGLLPAFVYLVGRFFLFTPLQQWSRSWARGTDLCITRCPCAKCHPAGDPEQPPWA
jgi:hypothetical protein